MANHVLKTNTEFFQHTNYGLKNFEVRKNDRNFAVGDYLFLLEYQDGKPTGKEIRRRVTYILRGGQFGIGHEYIVMQLEK